MRSTENKGFNRKQGHPTLADGMPYQLWISKFKTAKCETQSWGPKEMQRQKGFSLIELLIVVAIILIIAAIAIPSLLRARIAANEASAASSIRTINTAEITYNSTYPTIGYAAALLNLGGPLGAACVPASTSACLLDSVLANNGNPAGSGKSGYKFTTGTGTVGAGINIGYTVLAVPMTANRTGIRAFCAEEDAVVRVDPAGACSNTEAGILTFIALQ
ncbi:MAG TPA: prepilin-type N-terminal cleavage/methylation domain-containing protein [Candidatus Dormibacteraeota bacterium]|nr:prepilin-type N-terminal cleavage/methylation domain-containing protein [Candidatus Dormibacteraeota bacterium]